MSSSIVITEKTSQANEVRRAVGDAYGRILPAEGHLLALEAPADVKEEWKSWNCDVLMPPDGYYKYVPDSTASPGKKKKLSNIRTALKSATRVIIATDPDREGEVIGQSLVDFYNYNGPAFRVLFNKADPESLRQAFKDMIPLEQKAMLYRSGWARIQADQIYNLSLTRAATVCLREGSRGLVIGVGRVKTPTLGIICRREEEIAGFRSQTYYHITATARVRAGTFTMVHMPENYGQKERLPDKEKAVALALAADGFEGPVRIKTESKTRQPPPLFDLPSLQVLFGSRHGWPASKTLDIAQELYNGEGKAIITYPRSESRFLSNAHEKEVPELIAGLRQLDIFRGLDIGKPVIRPAHFSDKKLEGMSHHAIIPNVSTIGDLASIWPRLTADEKALFETIARQFLAAITGDWCYDQTTATVLAGDTEFKARGNVTRVPGWRAVLGKDSKDKDGMVDLPDMQSGESVRLGPVEPTEKATKPPPRYNEGSIIEAMQSAWKFVDPGPLQDALKQAEGIGTPATRDQVIAGLKAQGQIVLAGKHIVPTDMGMTLYRGFKQAAPVLVDPGVTAQWEMVLGGIVKGKQSAEKVIALVAEETGRLTGLIRQAGEGGLRVVVEAGGSGQAKSRPRRARKKKKRK